MEKTILNFYSRLVIAFLALVMVIGLGCVLANATFALGPPIDNDPTPTTSLLPPTTPTPSDSLLPSLTPTPRVTVTPGGTSRNAGPVPTIINPTKVDSIQQLVAKVIRILFGLIALVAVVVIIIAGFRLVAFGSNPAERTKAKNGILWAVIGLLVALMSFGIVSILQKLIQP